MGRAHDLDIKVPVEVCLSRIKPEIRAAADKEPPPDPAPFEVGLLPRDEYIITGEYAGQRGFFTRGAGGAVTGVDLAGRLASRN